MPNCSACWNGPGAKIARRNERPDLEGLSPGDFYAVQGDKAKAQEHFEEARRKAEAAVRESPGDGPRHALLGLIYGGLGRCADAAAEDAFNGPILAISRARIAALCG